MNDISLIYQNIKSAKWEKKFLIYLKTLLSELNIDNWEFSVTLCDNEYIKNINRDYRQKDKPTDVITFVMSDEPFPESKKENVVYSAGDILVSLETVKENAEYFSVPYEEEFKRVIIHGILHLMGYDHETNNKEEKMLILQEEILDKTSNEGIF